MDFNKAVKNWLLTCPYISAGDLFFNFLSASDGKSLLTSVENNSLREDICGNEIGKYVFSIVSFAGLADIPVLHNDENFDSYAEFSRVAEWIRMQEKLHNYPICDTNFLIEHVSVPSKPALGGTDKSAGLVLAKYILQIVIEYIKLN